MSAGEQGWRPFSRLGVTKPFGLVTGDSGVWLGSRQRGRLQMVAVLRAVWQSPGGFSSLNHCEPLLLFINHRPLLL
jgi:hypothetical protein